MTEPQRETSTSHLLFPLVGTIHDVIIKSEEMIVEWDIINYVELNGTVRSPPFFKLTPAGVSLWCLQVNTKMTKNGKDFVGIFVELVEKPRTCHYLAKCKFSIGNSNKKSVSHRFEYCPFANVGKTYGFPTFMTRKELMSDYIAANGRLLIKAAISIVQLNEDCTLSNKMENLLLQQERYGDFKLRSSVDGRELKVYKGIIASNSPVFETMMNTNMKETKESSIELPFSYETIHFMAHFMYTGTVLNTEYNTKELYEAAHMYDIAGLRQFCAAKLASEVSVDDVCEILILSDADSSVQLKTVCMKMVVKNAESLQKTESWQTLLNHKKLFCEVVMACADDGVLKKLQVK